MANPNFGPEYKLIREISSGGMGIVYLAEDHQLGRPVAIKVLREEFARDQASVDRFLNEARSMAALDHSNIVPVYRAVQSQSGPFFTMKFIDGQDLRTVLDNHGSFKIQDALQIIEAVGGALDYAHSKGLVHRDVKPANILMDANGVPWVGDFGIVRVVGKTGHTMTGMMVGTPEYMAPEQWDDVKYGEISGATDRYALGIMFYEMLVGNPPFSATNPMAVGVAHLNNQFPKLSLSSSQGLTNRLQPFLNRMTSKRSADRYQTCKAFSDDIRRALKDGPAPRGKNNSTGLYAVAGLAGIVAIAAIGMSMSGRSGPEVSSGVTGGGSNTSIGGGTSSGNGISTPASGEQVKEGEVVKPVERHSRNVSASELYFRPSSVLRDPVGDHTGELTMDGN
jgi:serine/threonine protein kinase